MAIPYKSPGVYVVEVPSPARPIAGVGTSTPAFIGIIPDVTALVADAGGGNPKFVVFDFGASPKRAAANEPYFVSSWSQFVALFGGFLGDTADTASTATAVDVGQRNLAHAVYGFFDNGGGCCYVLRMAGLNDLDLALKRLAAIDDVTMIAAPGMVDVATQDALMKHCESLLDRVAILDGPSEGDKFTDGDYTAMIKSTAEGGLRPRNSEYAAVYFPWLQVQDPAQMLIDGKSGTGLVNVPPSGHVAGIFARSDAGRGVFKAPANEEVRGAIGLQYKLSRADHNKLNGPGVNIIRPLIGAIRVWGARTVGGDANGDYKYISTRRYFNYLRESIEEGTQFVVFEPNTPALWKRIERSVTGFLTNEWRSGALFGTTADKAFYVKCDADTNPPEVRDLGQVVTEIGVAIVRPAEFVIFRISQFTAPAG